MALIGNGNGGSSKLVGWLMTITGGVLVALIAFVLQALNARLLLMEEVAHAQDSAIARIDATVASRREHEVEILERLKEIERKVDDLRRRR